MKNYYIIFVKVKLYGREQWVIYKKGCTSEDIQRYVRKVNEAKKFNQIIDYQYILCSKENESYRNALETFLVEYNK